MKKTVFGLIATFMLGNLSYGQINQQELDSFKKDELTLQLKVNFYSFLNNLINEDPIAVKSSISEGNTIIENLNAKFGKERVVAYLEALDNSESSAPTDPEINKIFGTHDGSPCTLNQDGTTYWGACSFWEGVSAYAAILANCGYVDFSSTQSEWINYAKCNQRQICNHC